MELDFRYALFGRPATPEAWSAQMGEHVPEMFGRDHVFAPIANVLRGLRADGSYAMDILDAYEAPPGAALATLLANLASVPRGALAACVIYQHDERSVVLAARVADRVSAARAARPTLGVSTVCLPFAPIDTRSVDAAVVAALRAVRMADSRP